VHRKGYHTEEAERACEQQSAASQDTCVEKEKKNTLQVAPETGLKIGCGTADRVTSNAEQGLEERQNETAGELKGSATRRSKNHP